MAGKKPTAVKPAPPSTQRSDCATSSPKHRPKQASKASAAGAKVPSPPKPRKNIKEKPAPAKKARDKLEPEAGAKRMKQQACGEAGTPKKKGKKRDEQEGTPHKDAKSTKKQQPSGKLEDPAPTPSKHKQQKQSGKAATPAKKQQSSGKAEKPAAAAPMPTKKQKSSGKAKKSAAAAPTPTKKQQKGGTGKSTPTKRKREDAEPQQEVRSPKRASGEGEAGSPATPAKKERKGKRGVLADMGTCSFPMARVRQLMRAEDDTIRASSEAVFLINKASELFLGKFADDAYRNALKDRKKSIIYDNLSTTVCNQKGLKFLSDFVPQRLRAEDALKAAAANPL